MNVLIVGELSEKLSFISKLLINSSLKEKIKNSVEYITVKNSDNFRDSIVCNGNEFEIYSVLVPFGINLFVDMSERVWTVPCVKNIEMVLFVEGYPFTTNSLLKNLINIEKFLDEQYNLSHLNNVCFRVMFHKECNRHFSANDLVGIDDTLKKAPDAIRKRLAQMRSESECNLPLNELIDFVYFSDINDIPKLFVSSRKILNYTTSMSRENFRKWQDSRLLINEEYAIKLMNYNDLTDSECIHDTTTKYEKVMGSKNIAEQYINNYYEVFSKRLYALAAEFYKEYITDVCFWDIDYDLEILKQRLDNLYFSRTHQICGNKFICPESREEYHNLCVTTKIGIHFCNTVNEFVKIGVAELVKKYIDEKDTVLSKIFGIT